MQLILIVIISITFHWLCIAECGSIGDECSVARTGARGTCKLLTHADCNATFVQFLDDPSSVKICGFVENLAIFCCPNPPMNITAKLIPLPKRISQKKCAEYNQMIADCQAASIPLIVGGTDAKSKEFPHMALIGYDNHGYLFWGCGGSLISDQYVMTAAHCLYNNVSNELLPAKYVRVGDIDISTDKDDANAIQLLVVQLIQHPDYDRYTKYNDIALLRLEKKIAFNGFVRPACLADSFESTLDSKIIATGWGHTKWTGEGSSVLQKVSLDLFNHTICSYIYSNNLMISNETQICAGSFTSSNDTCTGDSGGPLQQQHPYRDCMFQVIGVTSFGYECGHKAIPSIYARVFNYLDWIENIVWPHI